MEQHDIWILAKPVDFYGSIELVEFIDNKPTYFILEKSDDFLYKKSAAELTEKSELEIEQINPNRLRFHTKGKKYSVYSASKSITTDQDFETDYVRLLETKTSLTFKEIEKLHFELPIRGKSIQLKFNEDLESDLIKDINKRLGKQGLYMRLGKIGNSLILVFYSDTYIENVIPIEEITKKEIKLYGFPIEPFEIKCIIKT